MHSLHVWTDRVDAVFAQFYGASSEQTLQLCRRLQVIMPDDNYTLVVANISADVKYRVYSISMQVNQCSGDFDADDEHDHFVKIIPNCSKTLDLIHQSHIHKSLLK